MLSCKAKEKKLYECIALKKITKNDQKVHCSYTMLNKLLGFLVCRHDFGNTHFLHTELQLLWESLSSQDQPLWRIKHILTEEIIFRYICNNFKSAVIIYTNLVHSVF